MKFGGLMHLTLSGGRRMTIRGSFEERPSNVVAETVTNQDGSLDKTVTLRPFGFTFTGRDEGQSFNDLLLEENVNATLVEEHNGRTILYTAGMFSGEVSINRMNGEVSGLSFDARHRRQL
jgi:hypothetical protein